MTPQEELLALRSLVEKQKEELAAKDEIIEKQNQVIEKQSIQIENMIQALLHARKKLFGRSTEATSRSRDSSFFFKKPKTGGKAWCGTEKDHGQALNPNPATTRSSGRDACRTAKRGGRIRNPRRRDLQ